MEIKVKAEFKGEDKFEVTGSPREVKLYVDRQTQDRRPQGLNPLELFLGSLAGCAGVYAKNYLIGHAVLFKELTINAKAEISKDSPHRLVNLRVRVSTDADLGERREVFLRAVRGCTIHNTIILTDRVDIDIA